MYDAIVVGGRCAGAPSAMLLARRGLKVLLVDRATFPSDTLSTHFIWPRGISYLNRWGLLSTIAEQNLLFSRLDFTIENASFSAETPLSFLQRRFLSLHGDARDLVSQYACIRRRVLDSALLHAAIDSGVEFRSDVSVVGLLREKNRVTGVRLEMAGTPMSERARIVIGADGRNSVVAKEVESRPYHIQSDCTFAYWSYLSGFKMLRGTIQRRGRLAMAIVPTNFGANMTLVWGPKIWFPQFKADPAENFQRVIDFVNPQLGETIRINGNREERFYGTAEQTAYMRPSAGPGWMLAGDAACFKDQCGAIGITHAFRDSELVAEYAERALAADGNLMAYAETRENDVKGNFDFVCQQARMESLQSEELKMFQHLSNNPKGSNAFMAMYGDTLSSEDFSEQIAASLPSEEPTTSIGITEQDQGKEVFSRSPARLSRDQEELSLQSTCADFSKPPGRDLLERTEGFYRWYEARNQTGTWQYSRTLTQFPGPRTSLKDDCSRLIENGINFASQDYLALSQHPLVHEAAIRAIKDFGPHSAGSPIVIGNTTLSRKLEEELAEFLDMPHVILFPTGWAAGYGAITGLVRETDYVVMDRLSHACLQQGIRAATRNIVRHAHLDVDSAREKLAEIRSKDREAGILVVSEGLFSMDSDSPDLGALQSACREYRATLFVDVAHDLGALGQSGKGQLEIQKLVGKVDLVMGSFSKSFASNGGFLATRSAAVKQYLRMFGNPHVFSNALSPVQAAVARTALQIIRSAEGEERRQSVLRVVEAMRNEFTRRKISCLGAPSPIMPVPIGDERVSRIAHRILSEKNIAAMNIEFPLVAVGESRFRLQAMATHTLEEGLTAAEAISDSIFEAREIIDKGEADDLSSELGKRSAA